MKRPPYFWRGKCQYGKDKVSRTVTFMIKVRVPWLSISRSLYMRSENSGSIQPSLSKDIKVTLTGLLVDQRRANENLTSWKPWTRQLIDFKVVMTLMTVMSEADLSKLEYDSSE